MSDDEYVLKQASKDAFAKFALNYLGSIFALFKDNLSSVFMPFDSRSWRKQFIKDHFEEHGDGDFAYKGTRKYDDKSHLFFDYFQTELLPILMDEYGILSARVHGAEGDDIIAFICERLHEDICIWSVDMDFTQLLENTDRKVILIRPKMQTKFKKIYTTDTFDKIENKDVDLFNLDITDIDNSAVINVLNDLLNKGYRHFMIDPTADILTKIVAGDSSDTIPRVHPQLTAGKVVKVINRIRETVDWSKLTELIDSDDPEFIQLLNRVICETLKVNDPGETLTIRNNLKRNRILMRLNTKLFPTEVVSNIDSALNIDQRRRFNYYKFKKNFKT
jgi:hypothetical protein